MDVADLPASLDRTIAAMATLDDAKVARDYHLLRSLYFDHDADPARQRAFEARLRSRRGVD